MLQLAKRITTPPHSLRLMATTTPPANKLSLSHSERTAQEPRDNSLHHVTIKEVEQVNDRVRLLKLVSQERAPVVKFLAGQWLDVHLPHLRKPGGFTITSTPTLAQAPARTLELAIQHSPGNPAAAYLWQPVSSLLGSPLQVRVGGSFVWPPAVVVRRVVFVAGGVGVNPLMAMVSGICEGWAARQPALEVRFLYSVREPRRPVPVGEILFLRRLMAMRYVLGEGFLKLFVTGGQVGDGLALGEDGVQYVERRISVDDVRLALGDGEDLKGTVCYICGIPTMTDELVAAVQNVDGMDPRHVFFERWW